MPAVPVDLTGYTARLQIRETAGAADPPWANLTTENGGITITAAEGKIDLYISAVDTAVMPAKKGVYDLEMVAPGGDVTRLLAGTATISPEVTR